jgi:fermentation-respiration switch protein FrsA (DUF1100 family)
MAGYRQHEAGAEMAKRLVRLLMASPLIFIMLRWFEHSQVYQPDRVMAATGAELGRPFEDVWFKASDGVGLNGWFFPANTNSSRKRLAALVCHGNAGNISTRLETYRALLGTGVAVFAFDYRGYGQSHGRPTEEGTYLDAEAAHRWLQGKGFAGKDTIAFGESLGGGIASELAVRQPLAGLVLQSSFSCIPDVGAELFPWLPVRWISSIEYGTCKKLPGLRIPVLVMHSRSDELIRFHHAEKNYALANEPKMFWELEGGHGESCGEPEKVKEGMEKFLQMIEKQRNEGMAE